MKTLGVAEEEEEEEEEKDCCERPCSQARAGLASEAANMQARLDFLSQPTPGPGRQHQAWSAVGAFVKTPGELPGVRWRG